MDDTWNRNEFKEELEALLNIQLPVSQSKIESLRNLAIKHPKHRNYLVQCICKFIETAPPDYRLPGLYLIDAIVRRCKDDKEEDRIAGEYRKRFFVVFNDGALTGLFHHCIEKDKTRVDKVLTFWSEHVFPKQFVEQLKISVIQDIERRRRPVVLPTNYATDIALQQQGWQPGNTPPPPTESTTTHSVSPPVDNETDKVPSRLPQQGTQPQVAINTLDFSNAVMHFLSVLNYGGSLPMGMPQPPPMYGFSPTQYPYLSHTTTETTRSPTESKEVDIKTEDIPTCAEQTISEQAPTVVKNEVMDTPFDRPPIKESSQTSSLPPPPRTPPLPPQMPPSTPPLPPTLPTAQVPTVSAPKAVQPPKTPPLPPATLQNSTETAQPPVPRQEKPVPPPKTPPLRSIPPPKTPPLPPQVPQKRLREPSPVLLPKKVAKDAVPSSSRHMDVTDVNKGALANKSASITLNVNKGKATDLGTNVSKDIVKGLDVSKRMDTAKVQKSTAQEKKASVNAAPLTTKPSMDATATVQEKQSSSLRSATLTKPSRWDVKAKSIKPVDPEGTTKHAADSKTSGSSAKLSNATERTSSAGMTREEKDVGSSAMTGTTTKRDEVSGSTGAATKRDEFSGSTKISTEVTIKRDEITSSTKTSFTGTTTKRDEGGASNSAGATIRRDEISSSTKTTSTEPATKMPDGSKPSIAKDMDTDKPKEDAKNKRTAPDNAREPSPKRSKTTTTDRSSRSEPSRSDVSTKSRVEKIHIETKSTKSTSSPKAKKPSPQPTKDRGSRTTDQEDRYKSRDYNDDRRDYTRERDPRDREDDRRDYDREKDNHRYYSPQHDQPQRHSTPYSPTQPSSQAVDPVYSYSRFARPGPISDPTLRLGTIRVLSRTLYVGPMSLAIKEDEVTEVFSQFGEVMSVIFSYRPDKLKNAFVKFINRESLQAAKDGSDGITFRSRPVKVNWAHGFGPKHCFNYDRGESILILNRLSDEDCASLKAAPVGGFQGSRLRDQVTVEEPGALQQSTHREETGSPNFYQVQKFEEVEKMPQSEYQQQYYGNDYPPISNPGYAQTPVEANGFYDQQGNYVYFIPEQSPAYYGPPVYPTSGAAGQPQYYQAVPMQYQQPATPATSQQFAQYHQYAYPNYAPTNQNYYFQQHYPSSSTEYPPDYRRH